MLSNKVIGRYAKALFELAEEQSSVEAVYNDMMLISKVSKSNADFVMMLSSPIIKTDKKIAVLTALFGKLVNKLTMAYLVLIAKKRREAYIPAICEELVAVYRIHKGIKQATLKTSTALDAKTRQSLIDKLKTYTKNEIELIEEIQPELIGGFVLSFDNKQFDTSISKQLQKLHKEFKIKENTNN